MTIACRILVVLPYSPRVFEQQRSIYPNTAAANLCHAALTVMLSRPKHLASSYIQHRSFVRWLRMTARKRHRENALENVHGSLSCWNVAQSTIAFNQLRRALARRTVTAAAGSEENYAAALFQRIIGLLSEPAARRHLSHLFPVCHGAVRCRSMLMFVTASQSTRTAISIPKPPRNFPAPPLPSRNC